MAGGWAMVLGLGLCLTVLRQGGCHHPGTAIASQTTAALRGNFRLEPGDLVATAGQALELDCVPPLGHPEPYVTWKKDGVTLDLTGDRYMVTSGKLRVVLARRSDSGLYVCVAANAAGERESRAARVSVLEKPTIVRRPSDAVVVAGSTAELVCGAQGDPAPRVQWHKERGDLPSGRHEVDQEHTLRLYAVTPTDTGNYVCTAQSQLGTTTATAHLHVEDRLPMGQREAAPQDLLAMRLHLDNGTTLPTTAAVQLRWRMLMTAPVPEGYVVLYRCLLPASTPWVQHDVGRELSTIIPALRRGYKYEFKVRPYVGGTQGLDSNSRHLWIPEEVPSAAPQHVTVGQAEMGNGTVVISWEPPPPEAHNGIIQGYKVWSMGKGWQRPTNRTVDGDTHHLETLLPNLGTEFCVQVAAFNGAGLGVPSNATCGILGLTAGSTRVVQALWQPAVIAAAGSLLWLALLALLLLLCQHRTRQDAAARHSLVVSDSPWLGGPWKPGCAPPNLSSSSLSSRLLGSDGRDTHPSTLSLEPPSLGPPTPPNSSSLHGEHPPSLGDRGCCGGGHPGVRTSPSTPNPEPWECIHKRELHQVHSTPVLMGGPSHVRTTENGGEWGMDFGLAAGCPQQRGHDDDTATTTLAAGDPRQLPVFSSPKLRRGSASLVFSVTNSLVTPLGPPRPWHPPVTRSLATACPRDVSPVTRHPKEMPPITGNPRDMSPVTRHPKDMSPVTRIPRDMSPVSRHLKDMSPVTGIPRDMSPTTRHPRDLSPATRHQRDTMSATRHPEDMSLVTRCPRDMSPVPRHHRDTFLGSRYLKNMSPATRHPRDPSPVTKCQRDISPATRHTEEMSPTSGHQREITRLPKEKSPDTEHRRDRFLATRYPEDISLVSRHPKVTSPGTRHPRDTSPVLKPPEEMSPVPSHRKDTFLGSRYPEDMSGTRHPRYLSLITRHPRDMFLATRYPEDTSLATRHARGRSLVTGHLSPVFSDGVLTPQHVAKDLEMDEITTGPSSQVPIMPRSFSPLHTYGYIYGPPAFELSEEEEEEKEEQPAMRGSPEGSLLNGWGSVSEDNFASTRCSLVSSCDGSFLLDASFARALAVAIDGLCFGFEDTDGGYGAGPSPPPSPLEGIFSPRVPIPTWDWGTALRVPQTSSMEAAVGVPQHDGHGTGGGSPWTRGPHPSLSILIPPENPPCPSQASLPSLTVLVPLPEHP
ncbi:LOW QUALITY PROTEIN: roundabout homolog 4 [Rhynochetos jubatus]